HPPEHPATDGGRLVLGKIHFVGLAQQLKYLSEVASTLRAQVGASFVTSICDIRMTADTCQLYRNARRRQNEVDTTCGDGAVWHTIILCRLRILSERDAIFTFDCRQAQSPVGGGS